jgi:hypothetical protein
MTSATAIPGTVADITVDWLNQVLPDDIGTVASIRWEDLGEGVGILGEVSRLHLTYADDHDGPASIIAKCPSPSPENVFLCQAMGFYDREISFYREAASSMPVPTPRCLHADMAEGSVPFVLLLEEIPDVSVLDQIAGAGPDETAAVFSLLARVHAHFWGGDALDSHPWLPPMNNDMYKGSAALAAARIDGFRDRWDGVLDSATIDAVEGFIPRYAGFLDWAIDQGALTMAHTDSRCENYLFTADGAVTMIDFQFVTRFWGAWDVANWLGASMTVDDRRAHERMLVEHYHAELVANGVLGYPLDRCWRDIRASLLVQAFSQVVVSDLDGANERGASLLEEMVTRTFAAAGDYDIAGLVDTTEF